MYLLNSTSAIEIGTLAPHGTSSVYNTKKLPYLPASRFCLSLLGTHIEFFRHKDQPYCEALPSAIVHNELPITDGAGHSIGVEPESQSTGRDDEK